MFPIYGSDMVTNTASSPIVKLQHPQQPQQQNIHQRTARNSTPSIPYEGKNLGPMVPAQAGQMTINPRDLQLGSESGVVRMMKPPMNQTPQPRYHQVQQPQPPQNVGGGLVPQDRGKLAPGQLQAYQLQALAAQGRANPGSKMQSQQLGHQQQDLHQSDTIFLLPQKRKPDECLQHPTPKVVVQRANYPGDPQFQRAQQAQQQSLRQNTIIKQPLEHLNGGSCSQPVTQGHVGPQFGQVRQHFSPHIIPKHAAEQQHRGTSVQPAPQGQSFAASPTCPRPTRLQQVQQQSQGSQNTRNKTPVYPCEGMLAPQAARAASSQSPVFNSISQKHPQQMILASESASEIPQFTNDTIIQDPFPAWNLEYRQIICQLLKIDPRNAKNYSLDILRTYARAFSFGGIDIPWRFPLESMERKKGHFGIGTWIHHVVDGKKAFLRHIACEGGQYRQLGILRGDIDQNGGVTPKAQPVFVMAKYEDFKDAFIIPESVEELAALGEISNIFGLFETADSSEGG